MLSIPFIWHFHSRCSSLVFFWSTYSPFFSLSWPHPSNFVHYPEQRLHHACHSQPPFQHGLHQHHHRLHRGSPHGQPGLSRGRGRRSPTAVAGAGEEPSQSLQAELPPAPQPQPGRPGRPVHPALRPPECELPGLAARWRDLRPPGLHDFSDGGSWDLQSGSAVGVAVSYCGTADETAC